MYDITYCTITDESPYDCGRRETCKRYQQMKDIPVGEVYSIANLYNVCKEQDNSMYIKYDATIKEKDGGEDETK